MTAGAVFAGRLDTAAVQPVDVIVPVYRNPELTRTCLLSVLTANCRAPFALTVIDDASPDAEMAGMLQSLADTHGFCLIRHATNQGFVRSVNEGMALHPERDVVLLNSDAEVANDWLDRLVACACRRARVATVTPFSNNATLASFPFADRAEPFGGALSVAETDALLARHAAGQCFAIPTAVGFCMLIRRAALNAVGLFDAAAYGRGYGEENDFSMAAAAAGFEHRLAADVFVAHHGGVSFGDGRSALQTHAAGVLTARYPDYDARVRAYFDDDPTLPLRQFLLVLVAQASLRASTRQPIRVLHLLGADGGGMARCAQSLVSAPGASGAHFLLHHRAGVALLQDAGTGRVYPLWSGDAQCRQDWFEVLLDALQPSCVHWHAINVLTVPLVEQVVARQTALVVTLHDLGVVSPEAFAPEFSLAASRDSASDQAWRRRLVPLLRAAVACHAPSRFLAGVCQDTFDASFKITVLPHALSPAGQRPMSVSEALVRARMARAGFDAHRPVLAVVGALGPHKGLETFRTLVAAGGINWVLIGYTGSMLAPQVEDSLVVHGVFEPDELESLLRAYGADAVYFPPGMPESFCYALSDVWAAGWPAIAHDLGALGERVHAAGRYGAVLGNGLAPAEVVAKLVTAASALRRWRESAEVRTLAGNADDHQAWVARHDALWTSGDARPVADLDAEAFWVLQRQALEHLDDRYFRAALKRLADENAFLTEKHAELRHAVAEQQALAEAREAWALELSASCAEARQWIEKLEADNAALSHAVGSMQGLTVLLLKRVRQRLYEWKKKVLRG